MAFQHLQTCTPIRCWLWLDCNPIGNTVLIITSDMAVQWRKQECGDIDLKRISLDDVSIRGQEPKRVLNELK